MKKSNQISIFLVVIMLATTSMFTSCKYEEGPSISLRSKKSRVVNTWEINKATYNGEDITSLLGNPTFTFDKDNTYEIIDNGDREEGTWDFNSNKEELILKENGSSTSENWKILRLANDELWVEIIDDGNKVVFQFKAK